MAIDRRFEGDIGACLALYNSYLLRRMTVLKKKLSKANKVQSLDNDVLKSLPVVKFLDSIDDAVKGALERGLTTFTLHRQPLIDQETMYGFISQAPKLFGPLWEFLCDLRGVKNTHARKSDRSKAKVNSVFFELLTICCLCNRQRLV